jgi:hypothetical protein
LVVLAAVLASSLLLGTSASATAKSDIPGKVRAALLREALSYAWNHRAAEAAEVEAVRTTLAAAGHVRSSTSRPKNTPVYVVVLEAILITHCLVPEGNKAPKCDEVFELEYRASSLKLMRAHDWSPEAYPDLNKLGTAVPLTTPREPVRRPK